MKKLYLFLTLIALTLLGACKKEGVALFSDSTGSSSLYFTQYLLEAMVGNTNLTNDMSISFGYRRASITDSILQLEVGITGRPENVSRPYKISIADSSTLKVGEDCQILNQDDLAISPGKMTDTIFIKVNRTAIMTLKKLKLYLSLVPNNYFTTQMNYVVLGTGASARTVYYGKVNLVVDDIPSIPGFWDPAVNPNSDSVVGELGTYSAKKWRIILERYGLNLEVVSAPGYRMSSTLQNQISKDMLIWLRDMATKGTPVYEDDGTLMTMGVYAAN